MKIVIGRADGLGNRLEELALLVAISRGKGERAIYVWNRSRRRARNYSAEIDAPLSVVPSPLPLKATGLREEHARIAPSAFIAAAKSIKVRERTLPVDSVVHLRSTDRIRSDSSEALHQHFMSESMHKEIHDRLVNLCARTFSSVHVVGDDLGAVHLFASRLAKVGVSATYDEATSPWTDFGYLVAAKQIVMGSRFSSFSLMASAMGSQRIYVPDETHSSDLVRYGDLGSQRY